MVATGAVLMGFMGYLILWVLTAFSNTSSAGSRFTGTEPEKLMIVGRFSMLIVFGFFALVTGGWQLVFGRRNRVLSWSVVAVGIVLAIGTGFVIWRLD